MTAAREAKRIYVVAFNRDGEGQLSPAFDPREFSNEAAAIRFAKLIEDQHDCVTVWSRNADGTKVVLYSHGETPEMGSD